MSTYLEVAPDLLLWAVERAGWDDTDVNRKVPNLHEWIDGRKKPTLKQLEKFSNLTHTPFGMLFLPERPVEEVPIPDMRSVRNETVQKPSADLLDTIYLCQTRQDWYRTYAQENGSETINFIGSATVEEPPKVIATRIQRLLGLDDTRRNRFLTWDDYLRYLIKSIEDLGVLVMISGVVGTNTHRKLNPQEFRGFALADPVAPLIFVNGVDTKAAQIFTLIHELAHIWLGSSALSDVILAERNTVDAELWCNQVAAEVLVPLEHLRATYREELTVDEMERLAREFKVSTLVILRRMYDAKFVSWDEYRIRYEMEYKRLEVFLETKVSSGGGNFYNTQLRRLGRRFGRAVVASAYEGDTSFRDAYRLVGVKKHGTFANLATKFMEA